MSEVLKAFKFDGEPVTKEPYGSGHINSTFLVVTDKNKKYILQKINNKIFLLFIVFIKPQIRRENLCFP